MPPLPLSDRHFVLDLELHLNTLTLEYPLYTGTQGLVFVVDSQDRDRVDEAKQELHRILSDREMKDCLLLVFANKQDLPGAMSPAEVTEKLGLHRMRDRSWYVHPSCATTGEGLFEGLQWLSQNVKKRQP